MSSYGNEIGEVLLRDLGVPGPRPAFTVTEADAEGLAGYHRLRHAEFVDRQGLFSGTDHDDVDDDPRAVVLIARDLTGQLLGGVRLAPAGDGPDLGWWQGGRLVAGPPGVGAALVRAACARAEAAGALRFDATVQPRYREFFSRLGWQHVRPVEVAGAVHELMRWPIGRIAALADATKRELGTLLTGFTGPDTVQGPGSGFAAGLGGTGFVGDDAAPVPGSDLVAACDAILPSMVERDPEWAGWCAVLVNLNDLAAMGADPVGLLDAVAGPDAAAVARVLTGVRRACAAFGVPLLGGHTQFGVPAALSVTALGRTTAPVAGGGGSPGQLLRLTADLGGGWRAGHTGRQWDSSSHRTPAELRALLRTVPALAPTAAKDVSMAGIVGTTGMLAEAGGCAAVLDVAAIPRPQEVPVGDWLTCFPGFAMITAHHPGRAVGPLPGPTVSAICGQLEAGSGVRLRWPDGELTQAITGGVTGLGTARLREAS